MKEDKSQKNQEKRLGNERRKYEYALHIPERRSGKDRRRGNKIQESEALDKRNTSKKAIEKTKKSKD